MKKASQVLQTLLAVKIQDGALRLDANVVTDDDYYYYCSSMGR